jgi:hypothetical protein
MELDDDAVLDGAAVDLTVGTVAAVGTIVSAPWAGFAWAAVAVLVAKTVVQAAVTAFVRSIR